MTCHDTKDNAELYGFILVSKTVTIIAELLAREARASGAPWVRKFGKLSIRENWVITSAYSVRPYTLWG